MELRSYLALVRRWLWLIILCTVTAGGLAYLTSQQATPLYQSSATLLLDASNPSTGSQNLGSLQLSERLAETYASLLVQQTAVEAVTAELPQRPETVTVGVTPQRNTSLMTISVTSEDPEAAALIANKLAEYVNTTQRQRAQLRFGNTRTVTTGLLQEAEAEANKTRAELVGLDPESAIDQVDYSALSAKLSAQERTIEQLRTNLFSIQLQEDQSVGFLSVLEPATVPTLPISPRPLRTAVYGALLGLVAGIAAAFLIEYFDDTVKGSQDLQSALGPAVLALIGRLDQTGKRALATLSEGRSPLAEAYRMLRTNIRFAMVDDTSNKTLMITSPSPGEGKSTTAANLAVVMAQAGHRTILVDADLRRPVQHNIFNLPNKEGLTTALIERDQPLDQYLRYTNVPDLYVLTSGPMPPNPSELLGSHRMQDVIKLLQEQAEYVIVDTPPVLAVTDSSLLAGVVGGVVIVLRANQTRLEGARRALAQLQSVGARVIGTVLNGVKEGGGGYYYYYYNYYGPSTQERKNLSLGARMRAMFLSILPRRS